MTITKMFNFSVNEISGRTFELPYNDAINFVKENCKNEDVDFDNTTNTIEGFNNGIKRITKTKSSFPSDEALLKLLYLVSQDITRKWTMPIPNWRFLINF